MQGYSVECHRDTLDEIKKSQTEVSYHAGNLLTLLQQKNWDFISLSDTISYLSDEEMQQLFRTLNEKCNPKCTVAIRSFLRAPPPMELPEWKNLTEAEKSAHKRDGTGVYQLLILQKY
jgi:S-adenosylmethionine-diacylglycerol 3-amino-3-carboxypropyl transferase